MRAREQCEQGRGWGWWWREDQLTQDGGLGDKVVDWARFREKVYGPRVVPERSHLFYPQADVLLPAACNYGGGLGVG